MWCRRWDSNPRPRDYETLALPLSYTGTKQRLDAKGSVCEVSRRAPSAPKRNLYLRLWGLRAVERVESWVAPLVRPYR